MAFVIADRVRETTTTTGTGTITLAGAVANFETFTANLSNSDTTYYAIVDSTNNAFEVGLGTFTSSGTTLARSVIASSNSNNLVDFSAGTKDVFITVPASKIVVEDGSNNVAIGGTVTATAFSGSGASLTGVDVVNDTSPQLGGNLDLNGNDIVTTSNADLELAPNGTGHVTVKGNTNQGSIQFNCENNSHGQILKAAPHSESASNTLTLPSTGGDVNLVSTASTATLTNKTFGDNVSFGDNNITNVGDIAVDSISADGTDINVAVSDNSATAFTIKQGSDNYLVVDTANSSESVAIGTGISGTAISLGHTTSETTVNDNLTVTGNLTVSGTTTTVDSTTINVQNTLVFEGSTANEHETTLTTVDPTGDRTISLPNQSGTLPVLAAASTTQITSTPEELNLLDGVSGLVQADFTKLAAVDSTSGELNLLDGSAKSTSSITVADSDAIIIIDGTTTKQIPASDIKTYASADSATKGFATAMAIAL
jgi:hypothetical protein